MILSTLQLIPGIVTKQNGAVIGDPPVSVGDESTITYDAFGFIDILSRSLVNENFTNLPPTRRVSKGSKILVAQPGDLCWITIKGAERRIAVVEGVPFKEACP